MPNNNLVEAPPGQVIGREFTQAAITAGIHDPLYTLLPLTTDRPHSMASDSVRNDFADLIPATREEEQWDILTEHVRELSRAGLPLPESLRTSAASAADMRNAEVLRQLADRLDDGVPLPDAIRDSGLPGVATIAAALEAGHTTGDLYSVLEPVIYVESVRRTLAHRLRASLVYPTVVVAVGAFLAVTVLLVCYSLFTRFGLDAGFDPTTRMPLVASVLIAVPVSFLLVGLVEVVRAWSTNGLPFRWSPAVREMDDNLRYYALVSHLSILVDQDVALPEAFEIAGGVAGGRTQVQAIEMAESIRAGRSLDQLLTHFSDAPRVVRTLLGALSWPGGSSRSSLADRLREAESMLASTIDAQISRLDRSRNFVVAVVLGIGVMGYSLILFWPLVHAYSKYSLDPAVLG